MEGNDPTDVHIEKETAVKTEAGRTETMSGRGSLILLVVLSPTR